MAAAGAAVMKDLYKEPRARAARPAAERAVERRARAAADSVGRRRRGAADRLREHRRAARRARRRRARRRSRRAWRSAADARAIVSQLLCESLLLAAVGGVAGIALGYLGVQFFASLLAGRVRRRRRESRSTAACSRRRRRSSFFTSVALRAAARVSSQPRGPAIGRSRAATRRWPARRAAGRAV